MISNSPGLPEVPEVPGVPATVHETAEPPERPELQIIKFDVPVTGPAMMYLLVTRDGQVMGVADQTGTVIGRVEGIPSPVPGVPQVPPVTATDLESAVTNLVDDLASPVFGFRMARGLLSSPDPGQRKSAQTRYRNATAKIAEIAGAFRASLPS